MNDTYNFQSLLLDYQLISIPKIQRDYAQGRLTGKAPDVRENFLNDIFSGKVTSLDFIFGTAQEIPSDNQKEKLPSNNQKKFIPLDGQQRLTTLFLLYLYGVKTHKLDINNLDLKKFTYETRKAASDFCQAVVAEDWPEVLPNTALSDTIIKQKWFMNYWLNDPTVEGMLTMLDAIHKKAKFNYPNLDKITFRFFDMNEHNLSDNLYIKMNSRGKPLTAFENLKASIDKILPKTHTLGSFKWLSNDEILNGKETFDEQWKHCVDRQWSDMFWRYKEGYLSDPPFIRFFTNILSAYWIGINIEKIKADDDGEKDKFLRFLLSITGNEDYISFDKFKEVLPSKSENEENENDNNKKLDTLVFLADRLNSFHKLLELDNLPEICRPSWEKKESNYDLVNNILQLKGGKYNPSNKERAMFYALVKCPYISCVDTNKDDAKVKIKHWMRVFWNIVEQEQERIRNFIGAVHLINEISEKIKDDKDIYEWLANEQNEIKSGFMQNQVKEERAKAKQIHKNTFKEEDIIYAECCQLLKGSISALFENDDCEKVSFGQDIPGRIKLLDDLWKKNNDTDYTLVKVLISLYGKEKTESKLYLKKNQENWKNLVTDKLKECFRNNKGNTISQNCKGWQSMLANTNLIENSREDGKILGAYREKIVLWAKSGCTWNAYGNVILDSMHNNSLLSELINNQIIECDQKINDCDFFWGWDIHFKYKNNYFTYYTDNTICLMNEKWDGKKLRDTSKDNTPQNNFCFSVKETETADTFLKKLNCLIQQACTEEAGKSSFNECPNKEDNNLQS